MYNAGGVAVIRVEHPVFYDMNIKVSVDAKLSQYHSATWYEPESGGDIEELETTIESIEGKPAEQYSSRVINGLLSYLEKHHQDEINECLEAYQY